MESLLYESQEHEDFCKRYWPKCRWLDEYHQSLVYTLGISSVTRQHISELYDFDSGMIKPEALQRPWQTSTSLKTTCLAFNLYTDRLRDEIDLSHYSVGNIFACSYAPYYWQAIKLRYPSYCC